MTRVLSAEEIRALELLEFPKLLDELAGHCSLARAAARVRASTPLDDRDALGLLWDRVRELIALLDLGEDLPLGEILDLESVLGEERGERGPLDAAALSGVGAAAREMSRLLSFIRFQREHVPLCAESTDRSQDPGSLGGHLEAALEPDGRVRDGASPKLAGLRKAVLAAESSLRSQAQRQMRHAVSRGWTSAEELTLRGERYCVPVKSGHRGDLPGVVHDRSASGQTFFVEPLEVVEASNQLQECRLEVREEEARIVRALNSEVSAAAPSLLQLFHRAVELDALRARARWGRIRAAHPPQFDSDPLAKLVLKEFRHPLLESALEATGKVEELVPLDLELDGEDRLLLISGPNAGGKTVVLKAVGLAACMAQTGIPLPCRGIPRLRVFDRILLELGDDQSLSDALSHFSAHLRHLRAIHVECTQDSLVLLDELGGGTDPVEGVALARAYLEALIQRGTRVLATTHYGQLKAMAHDRSGFRNAGMAYDDEKLRPLFRLVLDVPGASRGLEIAERMGLSQEILERAAELVGDESLRLERVLAEMESQREGLLRAREDSESEARRLRNERERFEERTRELKQQRRELLDRAEQEAEGIVRQARARIERLLERMRREGGGGEALKDLAREAREEVDRRAEQLTERLELRRRKHEAPRAPARIVIGQRLRHAGLGLVGTVVEIRGQRVTLEAAGRRIQASAEELEGLEGAAPKQEGSVRTPELDGALVSRVDVRGNDLEDAWSALDHALDRCILAGTHELELIHGKGTGTLRRGLHQRLATDSRVRRHHLADAPRGDDGLTIVELA